MHVTVLGVQSWAMKTEDNQPLDGITIHFFDSSDKYSNPDKVGIFPASITADKSLFSSFSDLPAKYDLDVRLVRGAGGKSKPEVTKVSLIGKQ